MTKQLDPIPSFAIVGHPNKGKSSLVSTLSQDDSVAISSMSGTTAKNHVYPMQVDGELLYQLIDTPGFQRSRTALQWMSQRCQSPADRANVVKLFIRENQHQSKFDAECQLLEPIVNGAGILYVVDGSLPYGPEYDSEMEILRWTGQPSMALINQIGEGDYIAEWQQALSQYFRIVRIFNAQTADFQKQTQLLSGFSELNESWNRPLKRAVVVLKNQRISCRQQAAVLIAAMIKQMLDLTIEHSFSDDSPTLASHLEWEFKQSLRHIEQQCRSAVEQLHNYQHLELEEDGLAIITDDLFSESSWKLFGLTNEQLLAAGAVGGAATGSTIDLFTAGSSLLLGTGVGAILGTVAAWFGGEKLVKVSVKGRAIGNKRLVIGPIKSFSFPYIALGRAICHYELVDRRTHAQRARVQLTTQANIINQLFEDDRKQFDMIFAKMRKPFISANKSELALKEKVFEKLENIAHRHSDEHSMVSENTD